MFNQQPESFTTFTTLRYVLLVQLEASTCSTRQQVNPCLEMVIHDRVRNDRPVSALKP